MRTTREELEKQEGLLMARIGQWEGDTLTLPKEFVAGLVADTRSLSNIVEAIGKIEPWDLLKSKGEDYHIHSGENFMLDRINTIIKDNGDKR